ncbi:MAG: hypothetical protein ACREA9_06415 [Pyrinomonadaceae bacterium]
MNIYGDYLWDRAGEPDPEIQELEETLGTLSYQRRPLEVPADLQVGRERSFFRRLAPRLAVAATIVMLLLGLGLWLGLQRLHQEQGPEIVKTGGGPKPNPAAVPSPDENRHPALAISPPEPEPKRVEKPSPYRVNHSLLARKSNTGRNAAVRSSQFTAKQQQEAEAAKDQLMRALRVASAKLNFAQRKTQDLNQREPVHNQHRIG